MNDKSINCGLFWLHCGFIDSNRRFQTTIKTCLLAGSILFQISLLKAQSPIPIVISSKVPNELNPENGGAPNATPDQAAAFAWQEFIALNWPAGPQEGMPNQRDTPSAQYNFGDPKATGPLVWETLRGKVEIFPGINSPPGYPGTNRDPSFGYDSLPQYNYSVPVPAGDPSQALGFCLRALSAAV